MHATEICIPIPLGCISFCPIPGKRQLFHHLVSLRQNNLMNLEGGNSPPENVQWFLLKLQAPVPNKRFIFSLSFRSEILLRNETSALDRRGKRKLPFYDNFLKVETLLETAIEV